MVSYYRVPANCINNNILSVKFNRNCNVNNFFVCGNVYFVEPMRRLFFITSYNKSYFFPYDIKPQN